jgi:hypothetical protein
MFDSSDSAGTTSQTTSDALPACRSSDPSRDAPSFASTLSGTSSTTAASGVMRPPSTAGAQFSYALSPVAAQPSQILTPRTPVCGHPLAIEGLGGENSTSVEQAGSSSSAASSSTLIPSTPSVARPPSYECGAARAAPPPCASHADRSAMPASSTHTAIQSEARSTNGDTALPKPAPAVRPREQLQVDEPPAAAPSFPRVQDVEAQRQVQCDLDSSECLVVTWSVMHTLLMVTSLAIVLLWPRSKYCSKDGSVAYTVLWVTVVSCILSPWYWIRARITATGGGLPVFKRYGWVGFFFILVQLVVVIPAAVVMHKTYGCPDK